MIISQNRQNSQTASVWVSTVVILMTAGFLATISSQHMSIAQNDRDPSETVSWAATDNASKPADVMIVTAGHPEFVATVSRPQAAAPARPAEPRGQILAYIKGRDHVVGIYSGQRFDVRDLEGKLVASDLDVLQFRRQYPELYENYRTSFAEAWAGMDGLNGLEQPPLR